MYLEGAFRRRTFHPALGPVSSCSRRMLQGAIHHCNYFIKSTQCAWELEERELWDVFSIINTGWLHHPALKNGVCSRGEGFADSLGEQSQVPVPPGEQRPLPWRLLRDQRGGKLHPRLCIVSEGGNLCVWVPIMGWRRVKRAPRGSQTTVTVTQPRPTLPLLPVTSCHRTPALL